MYPTKDGKKKGSAYVGKRYDEMHGKNAVSEATDNTQHEAAETPEFEAGEQEGMNEPKEGAEETHPVVAAHGKAVHVHIHHDHAANKHHVESDHEDGHKNMTEHQSPQEAHEEGGRLAGVSVQKENKAKGVQDAQQGAKSEEDGFEMPPLV